MTPTTTAPQTAATIQSNGRPTRLCSRAADPPAGRPRSSDVKARIQPADAGPQYSSVGSTDLRGAIRTGAPRAQPDDGLQDQPNDEHAGESNENDNVGIHRHQAQRAEQPQCEAETDEAHGTHVTLIGALPGRLERAAQR